MTGLGILDLLIGMFFVYFLLSIICSALQEIRARVLNLRSKNLEKWIKDTFQGLGDNLIKNVIIDGMTQKGRSPAYIPKEVFTNALLEEIHFDAHGELVLEPYTLQSLAESIRKSTHLPVKIKAALLQAHYESQTLNQFRDRIGIWFDRAMERNAGTFKRKTQTWVLTFSIIVAVALNVDSLKLMQYFYRNPAATKEIADTAEQVIREQETVDRIKLLREGLPDSMKLKFDFLGVVDDIKEIKAAQEQLSALKLPIGWDLCIYKLDEKEPKALTLFWIVTILGWSVTALAISLGATFWFDVLNKLVDLRSTGKKPPTTAFDKEARGTSSLGVVDGIVI